MNGSDVFDLKVRDIYAAWLVFSLKVGLVTQLRVSLDCLFDRNEAEGYRKIKKK